MKKLIAATMTLLFAASGAYAAAPEAVHAIARACGCCDCC